MITTVRGSAIATWRCGGRAAAMTAERGPGGGVVVRLLSLRGRQPPAARRHGHRAVGQVESDNGRRGGRGLSAVRSRVLQPVRVERRRRRRRRRGQHNAGRQVQESLVSHVVAPLPKGHILLLLIIIIIINFY